jgi:hypothetical protein
LLHSFTVQRASAAVSVANRSEGREVCVFLLQAVWDLSVLTL